MQPNYESTSPRDAMLWIKEEIRKQTDFIITALLSQDKRTLLKKNALSTLQRLYPHDTVFPGQMKIVFSLTILPWELMHSRSPLNPAVIDTNNIKKFVCLAIEFPIQNAQKKASIGGIHLYARDLTAYRIAYTRFIPVVQFFFDEISAFVKANAK